MNKCLVIFLCALVTGLTGCSSTELRPVTSVEIGAVQILVPGPSLPDEVKPLVSNNNLDVVDFDGRTYMAFRTSPTHFASTEVKLLIVSRLSGGTWRFEHRIALGRDLREPRFLAFKGTLFLFFAQLGKKISAFEPGEAMRIDRKSDGSWTPPARAFKIPGFIPWRIKFHQGKPIMIGYEGGEFIYDFSGKPLKVHLLTTTDGRNFTPLNPAKSIVLTGGTSETDITFDSRGRLFAVARNEAGEKDKNGKWQFGSKICTAPPGDLTAWTCIYDRRKYDSPLLFTHDDTIYLVGRRNLAGNGNYDLDAPKPNYKATLAAYQISYWTSPKRCSLWRVNKETLNVEFVLDFPSKGDTCFVSILRRGVDRYEVYNYTSALNGEDIAWNVGQQGKTSIYTVDLIFKR